MKPSTTDCLKDDLLSRWLDDDVSDDEQSTIVSHLDDCSACGKRLEELAADAEFWSISAASLRDETDWQLTDDEPSRLSPVLVALLGPSENPYSLGRIGRFEIVGVVGGGGMGTVLKARDVDIDRIVALKLPASHLMESPTALERIEREARSAATIRHPGIIEIYQVERWRGIPYLVMPFHTGPSLTARIESDGPLELLESIRVARQTAEALAAAHDHGVIHRDVKPGNILLGKGTERAVLTDFGIAKIQDDAEVTATGVIVGTPAFLSPEQASGRTVTCQSDLFSLGSVLWSMLAGRPPFANLPTHTVVTAIASGDMPAISTLRDDLPSWVGRLIEWMHKIDPEDRPGSARTCAQLLRECEQHLLDPHHHPLPSTLNVRYRKKRRLSIAVITLIVVAGCWALLMQDRLGFVSGSNPAVQVSSDPVDTTESDRESVQSADATANQSESVDRGTTIDEVDESIDKISRELSQLIAELEQISAETRLPNDPTVELPE